jgi:hypothetical protein
MRQCLGRSVLVLRGPRSTTTRACSAWVTLGASAAVTVPWCQRRRLLVISVSCSVVLVVTAGVGRARHAVATLRPRPATDPTIETLASGESRNCGSGRATGSHKRLWMKTLPAQRLLAATTTPVQRLVRSSACAAAAALPPESDCDRCGLSGVTSAAVAEVLACVGCRRVGIARAVVCNCRCACIAARHLSCQGRRCARDVRPWGLNP